MVKPCENEECGKPFIAKRRDTKFCSASCRARAHTLKSRREYLLARSRVEAVRGLGELAAELRVGRDQAADAVAELSARVDTEVAAQARRARAAATEGRRRDERLREVEAQLLRVTTVLAGLEQRLVAVDQAVAMATARLGGPRR